MKDIGWRRGKGAEMINEAPAKMGRIRYWYSGEKGYGFIRPEDGGEAVFVHHTCV